jgi:hypothetical protein
MYSRVSDAYHTVPVLYSPTGENFKVIITCKMIIEHLLRKCMRKIKRKKIYANLRKKHVSTTTKKITKIINIKRGKFILAYSLEVSVHDWLALLLLGLGWG